MVRELPEASARHLLGTQDLHVHTTMSDGDLSLEEVVRVASARGVHIGIADHVSRRNPDLFVSTAERLDSYLDAIGAVDVFRSAELCWCDEFSGALPRDATARLDYLIGSNHGFQLPDGLPISPWTRTLPAPWSGSPQEVMDITVEQLRELVATMPIAIVAHSTLLPPALLSLEPDVHAWWTEKREARFIEAIVESGVAIEISNRYRLPHDRFLIRAREAGARFTLGSDGHQRDQIARLDWAIEAAHRTGITDAHLFVPDRR